MAAVLALVVAAGGVDASAAHPRHRHHRHHRQLHGERVFARHAESAPRASGSVQQQQGQPPAPAPLARVQVVAKEFTITTSRAAVDAGKVAVEFDNRGEDPHNLRVERTDDANTAFNFDTAKPGSVASRKLDLGAGTWKLYCTLPGHEGLGMHATITVGG